MVHVTDGDYYRCRCYYAGFARVSTVDAATSSSEEMFCNPKSINKTMLRDTIQRNRKLYITFQEITLISSMVACFYKSLKYRTSFLS